MKVGGVGGVRASLLTSEKASTALSCRPLSAEQFAAWNLQSAETNVPSNSEVVASVWTRDEEEGRETSVRRKYEKQPCKKTNKNKAYPLAWMNIGGTPCSSCATKGLLEKPVFPAASTMRRIMR